MIGVVLDEQGAPVANAKVGSTVFFENDKWKDPRGVTTNDKGEFSFTIDSESKEAHIFAVDDRTKRAGWANLRALGERLTIQLLPMATIHFRLDAPEIPRAERGPNYIRLWCELGFTCFDVRRTATNDEEFSLFVPSGLKYRLLAVAPRLITHKRELEVPVGATRMDLGTISLQADFETMFDGKPPPPLRIAEAIGLDRNTTLEDLRGKWVLLQFGDGVDQLILELDAHRFPRDQLEPIVVSREWIPHDPALELPFSMVVDDMGKTHDAFRVTGPTQVLINPDGRVVAKGDLAFFTQQFSTPSPDNLNALERRVTFEFAGTPLKDVVAFLIDYTGLNVVVDWPSCASIGVTEETLITMRANNVRLRPILEILLDSIGLTFGLHPDGGFRIGAREAGRKIGPTKAQHLIDSFAKEAMDRRKISLDFDNISLSTVAGTIQRDGGLSVLLLPKGPKEIGIDPDKPVSVHCTNAPLPAALDRLCNDAGLKWSLVSDLIVISAEKEATVAP